jgi:hypothetical protein
MQSTFSTIVELDKDIFTKRHEIEEEILKLKNTYNTLIKDNNKKIFLFCLDSFYFQYRILHQEMEDLAKFITILNNRMYGEYYKLYNIIIMQLKERNIHLPSILENKKYPIYKDLEQLKEYSVENITDVHTSILEIINELYMYYNAKQKIIADYSNANNINMSISNFIHTLEYENILIREQLYLYISYIEFFHSTQMKYFEKLTIRMNRFHQDVSENIITHAKNTSFIDNIQIIKDVILTPPTSPSNGTCLSNKASSEIVGDMQPYEPIGIARTPELGTMRGTSIGTSTSRCNSVGIRGLSGDDISSQDKDSLSWVDANISIELREHGGDERA